MDHPLRNTSRPARWPVSPRGARRAAEGVIDTLLARAGAEVHVRLPWDRAVSAGGPSVDAEMLLDVVAGVADDDRLVAVARDQHLGRRLMDLARPQGRRAGAAGSAASGRWPDR